MGFNDFIITVNETLGVSSDNLDHYLDKGYKIIGTEQVKDCDGLIRTDYILGRHNPEKD